MDGHGWINLNACPKPLYLTTSQSSDFRQSKGSVKLWDWWRSPIPKETKWLEANTGRKIRDQGYILDSGCLTIIIEAESRTDNERIVDRIIGRHYARTICVRISVYAVWAQNVDTIARLVVTVQNIWGKVWRERLYIGWWVKSWHDVNTSNNQCILRLLPAHW